MAPSNQELRPTCKPVPQQALVSSADPAPMKIPRRPSSTSFTRWSSYVSSRQRPQLRWTSQERLEVSNEHHLSLDLQALLTDRDTDSYGKVR
jgi:hypothetical protein